MIGVAVLVVTGASLAVTATVFGARQWGAYLGGNLLLAATYALLGVCLGPIFGPVGGVHRVPVPFLDIGIGQSPMLPPARPPGRSCCPATAPDRVLLDGGLTARFDETGSLLLGLACLLASACWPRGCSATARRARRAPACEADAPWPHDRETGQCRCD